MTNQANETDLFEEKEMSSCDKSLVIAFMLLKP